MLPHAYATGGGFADVIQLLLDTHMDSALNTYGKCSVQADRLAQLGRQDRPSDNVTCKHLDTLYHPKTDGSEGSFAHTQCAYIIASAILLHGCPSLALCTSLQ